MYLAWLFCLSCAETLMQCSSRSQTRFRAFCRFHHQRLIICGMLVKSWVTPVLLECHPVTETNVVLVVAWIINLITVTQSSVLIPSRGRASWVSKSETSDGLISHKNILGLCMVSFCCDSEWCKKSFSPDIFDDSRKADTPIYEVDVRWCIHYVFIVIFNTHYTGTKMSV